MDVTKLEIEVAEVVVASPPPPPVAKASIWRDRIHNFSWQWHVIVMATGVCSSLLHMFPYHNGSLALKIAALTLFILDLVIFVLLCSWTVARCIMFPEDWSKILTDPAKSLFIGFFANGVASLINAGLSVYRDWGMGGSAFLYTLWGFWWLDCCLSCFVAFGLVYIMIGQNTRGMSKVGPVWMVPLITLITISASGGGFTRALLPHSHILAVVSLMISTVILLIGLSFTMMFTTAFLLRLYLHGPLDPHAVLTTFTTLTPLGQGGYSLLLNGQDLANILPQEMGDSLPDSPLIGQILFSICFCGAFALWSMGVAWIVIACFSIIRRASALPPFCISHWCVIVPNGTFAALSVQLAAVLNSPFFRAFGAIWSCIVFFLWAVVFLRSIPALIDGSMFKPTHVVSSDKDVPAPAKDPGPPADEEKAIPAAKAEEVKIERVDTIESTTATLYSIESTLPDHY